MLEEDKKGLVAQMDALVRDHLPQKVGETLRRELERLEKVEKALGQLQAENESLKGDNTRLRALGNYKHDLDELERRLKDREATLRDKETALSLHVAVQNAVAEVNKARIEDLKDVVKAVFANNQFKYTRVTNRETPHQPGYSQEGYLMSTPATSFTQDTETVEGEGPVQ